jgi:predicted TIM-barrel fold metal-dependent hydrolase
MSFITLEEHYLSTKVPKDSKDLEIWSKFPSPTVSKLESLGDERLQDLKNGSVSLQVLSHVPLDGSPAVCTEINDDLALNISKSAGRLAGFAILPMEEPKAAANELSRCVTEHGFLGALLDTHLHGQFYDDERFWPVFEKAEELDVPIYIHPTFASEPILEHYKGNYDDSVALALSAFGWGWHAETGHHVLRLFASGLFDKYPKLKIIIGHMGELLPFQIDRTAGVAKRWGNRERDLMTVWRNNIWITTSGMFSLAPLACLLQTTTIDHVLYSVDYPFSSNETGMEFFEKIKKSGLISGDDLEKFAYKNAEVLLKVKAGSS